MERAAIIDTLRTHETELRALGVRRLSLFGSLARGDAQAGSDVDLAITLEDGHRLGLFGFAALRERLERLVDARVDLLSEPIAKPRLRASVERDRVHVF